LNPVQLHHILDLDNNENLYLLEDSFIKLKNIPQSLGFMEQIARSGYKDGEIKIVLDEDKHIICLALNNPESKDYPSFWTVFTDIVSRSGIHSTAVKKFEAFAQSISDQNDAVIKIETTSHELDTALREYLSYALVERQLCDECVRLGETYEMVYLNARINRLTEFLSILPDRFNISGRVLEICCGNGMATLSLNKLGIYPLTIDNDRCQICQGLEHGVLKPECTAVMDAKLLSDFFNENTFDTVIGFMLGTIYNFDKDIWIAMMNEALKVVKPGGTLLFTLNKKEEMDVLKEILDSLGVVGEVIDNTNASGTYDQWVYLGHK
jgi:hypothetical protein